MSLEQYQKFGVNLAREAGILMRRYFFDADPGTTYKADKSPLTKADTEINELVISMVGREFPDHGVLAEERSTMTSAHNEIWVCDPVDGTKAFTWGLPTAMFSLAYVKDGEALVGIVYDPFLERMYTAMKGKGALCNGSSLKVSDGGLRNSFYGGGSARSQFKQWNKFYDEVEARGARIMCFSGAVYKMMLVASGKSVGYAERELNSHDIAAAKVIVEEAGGKVTLLDGSGPKLNRLNKGALVSNGKVHDDLLRLIAKCI